MMIRVTLLLLTLVAFAPRSWAGRVRVEFEAELVEAVSAFLDPAQTLRGYYAFDTSTLQTTESAASSLTFANLSEFVLEGVSAVRSPNEGLATRLQIARPADPITRPAQTPSALSVWSVQVGLVSPPETVDGNAEADTAQRLADDINGNGNSGQTRVRADIDGSGILEEDEIVAIAPDFREVFEFDILGIDSPLVLQPEAVLRFAMDQPSQATNDGRLAPPPLEDLSSATLSILHRGFGFVRRDPLSPTLGMIAYELEYDITSLRVVTIPEPHSLLLLAGALGAASLFRRSR